MKKNRRFLFLLLFSVLLAFSLLYFNNKNNESNPELTNTDFKNSLAFIPSNDSKTNEMESNNNTLQIEKPLLLGKVNAAASPLFAKVKTIYANRTGIYLLTEVYEAFIKMHDAALEERIRLVIFSGFRNFDHQKRIWNNKWNGVQLLEGNIKATSINDPLDRITEILKYSAMPGTSRHHWGTDIDLNSLSNSYFEGGQGKKVFDWLKANAAKFGFFQPYTPLEERTAGHMEEKWHWSYLPISSVYLDSYLQTVNFEDLKGFEGDFLAKDVDVIKNYVLGINKELLNHSSTQR